MAISADKTILDFSGHATILKFFLVWFSFLSNLFRPIVGVSEEAKFHHFEMLKLLDKLMFVICCFDLLR
jgi:hypothetical protein